MKRILSFSLLAISAVFLICFVSCGGDAPKLITDTDKEQVLYDIGVTSSMNGIFDNEEDEQAPDTQLTLSIGESKVRCIAVGEEALTENAAVFSTNPSAVSCEIIKNVGSVLFYRITANAVGNASVWVEVHRNSGENAEVTLLEKLRVSVPESEIYAAEFGNGEVSDIELHIGEARVDSFNVYAFGSVASSEIELCISDASVASAKVDGSSRGEYFTKFFCTLSALSEGKCEMYIASDGGKAISEIITLTVTGMAEADKNTADASSDGEAVTYILNIKSMKFHDPSCRGTKDMKPANKGTFAGTREEIIAQGYTPCGICKP